MTSCGGEVGCFGFCTSVRVACVSRSPDFPVGLRNGVLIRPRVPLPTGRVAPVPAVGRGESGVRGVRGVEGDSEVHWAVIMFPYNF